MLNWRVAETAREVAGLGTVTGDRAEAPTSELLGLMGARMNFERNAEIFGEEEPADYLYKVLSGAVRICKLMSDGRRQIGAFYLPGDVFGMEPGEVHRFAAEAIADSSILIVKRSAFIIAARRNSGMVAELWTETMTHLQQAQEHMLVLGRKNAQERIATFLLEMARRLSKQGAVELPMPRQDIADYLGLTIETVSRTFTQLERDGVIAMLASRRIVLRNRTTLDRLNDTLAA